MALVHLTRCEEYELETVRAAVRECWQAVAAPDLIRPGMTVLLKPNVINDMPPERAVCTHPQVVRAVAELALEAGAKVTIADQPGYALAEEAERAFEHTGMIEACQGLPVTFELLARGGYRDLSPAQPYRLKSVQYSARCHEADLLINLCKAKTHSQTLFTGAVKNMFGAMAPRQRLETHLLGGYWALSEAIVDCYAIRPPDLHLVDAIDVMEGMGPTQGTPRRLGMVAASTDGVALDAVAQAALGFGPEEIATTVAACNAELGERDLERLQLTGVPLEQFVMRIARAPVVRADMLGPLMPLLRPLIAARPMVRRKDCRACGACAGICPKGAIAIEDYAVIDPKLCVECFCCLEACPFDAIYVKRSPLYGAAFWVKKKIDRLVTSR